MAPFVVLDLLPRAGADMDAETTTLPTWGYKPDGSAQIFNLAPGEALPEGWQASPACIEDPALATAEALSARAAGRAYVPPVFEVPKVPVADEVAKLRAIIDAGMAENARLYERLDAADADLATANSEAETARAAHAETLEALERVTADVTALRVTLAAAETDRTAALAQIEALTADLAAATAPKAPTAPAKPK